jgi:hypothetical protein
LPISSTPRNLAGSQHPVPVVAEAVLFAVWNSSALAANSKSMAAVATAVLRSGGMLPPSAREPLCRLLLRRLMKESRASSLP